MGTKRRDTQPGWVGLLGGVYPGRLPGRALLSLSLEIQVHVSQEVKRVGWWEILAEETACAKTWRRIWIFRGQMWLAMTCWGVGRWSMKPEGQ